jgi:MFS transporter, DHA1 family, multidrug resistance protein
LLASKQLSDLSMLIFVAVLSAFPAFSTDLYLPALPSMSAQLKTSVSLVNLTLAVFFVFLSLSMLIWGPLSDRYGRKTIILSGVPIYIGSSMACAISQDVYQLIGARIFQAIGGGAAMAVAMAIVKDYFTIEKRDKAFAMVGILTGIIPVIAPVIGAQILKLTSWRGTFVALTISSILIFIFGLFFKETNTKTNELNVFKTCMRLFIVLENKNFTILTILFSMLSMSTLAYISVSSFIYIEHFGLNAEAFSLFFGTNSMFFIIGGPIYLIVSRYFKPISLISVVFILYGLSGFLVLLIGNINPIMFFASFGIVCFAVSFNRPAANTLLLEQIEGDTGSASSIIMSFLILAGSAGMVFISLEWENRIRILGYMNVVLGLLGLIFWLYLKPRCKIPAHFQ